MSAKGKALAPASRSGRFSGKAAILLAGLGALAALPLCMVALPGMLPSIVMFFIERERARYASYTVAALNFAGVFPILLTILRSGMSFTTAAEQLSQPFSWLVMYGAAGVGWLVCGAAPIVARTCVEIQIGQKRRALEALGKAIREEWGPEVGGAAKKE